MKIFTSRPIIEARSNADGENLQMVKDYLSTQKHERKESRGKAVSDVLSGSSSRRDTRRGSRETSRGLRLQNKDSRVSERIANRQARSKRRTDRKAKRNAKKLILVKTPRSADPKFFFPLQKLRLSKKKKGKYEKTYADGTTSEVDRTMVVTDPNTGAVYDKKEISNATGVPLETVTPQTIKSVETTTTVDPNTNQPTLAIEVNDNLISGADDGNAYLNNDTQGSEEKDANVADDDKKKEGEKQPMTKTTKIIIGVAVTAVVGLIVYAVVKGRNTVPKI
jgi:hypothetical protein